MEIKKECERKMKNERKIKAELSDRNLKITSKNGGLRVTSTSNDKTIYGPDLRAIIAVAKKYKRSYYVDFECGHMRIH